MQIKDQLKNLNHIPRKNLGQNFLVNEKAISKIVNEAIKDKPKKIIEIGPGLGSLTKQLIKHPHDLLLIEKDKNFVNQWGKTKIIHSDAIKLDWNKLIEPNTTLVSNLPYKIASRIVVDRSIDKNHLSKMVLMFQKEVAGRVIAKKSTKDYGILSVIAQSFWDIKKLIKLGPKDFYPQPKIFSEVMVFTKKNQIEIDQKQLFLKFVKHSFSNRRKKILSNLPMLQTFLKECNISENVRAQELSCKEFQKLFCISKKTLIKTLNDDQSK